MRNLKTITAKATKSVLISTCLLFSITTFASDFNICYKLTDVESTLCIKGMETNHSRIHVLVTIINDKMQNLEKKLGEYALMTTGRCIDCNENFFGRIFKTENSFSMRDEWSPISFKGKVDLITGFETGVVKIATQSYRYEREFDTRVDRVSFVD